MNKHPSERRARIAGALGFAISAKLGATVCVEAETEYRRNLRNLTKSQKKAARKARTAARLQDK